LEVTSLNLRVSRELSVFRAPLIRVAAVRDVEKMTRTLQSEESSAMSRSSRMAGAVASVAVLVSSIRIRS